MNARNTIVLLTSLTLVMCPVMAQVPTSSHAAHVQAASDADAGARAAQIQSAMAQVLPSADFDETPLEDVIAFLGDISKLNIFVKWNELDQMGFGHGSTVGGIHLYSVPFKTVLEMVLASVSPDIGYDLTDDGILVIAPKSSLIRTATYDVAGLVDDPSPTGQVSLVDAITGNIDPSSWDVAGGYGRISLVGSSLIVTQTTRNHREIQTLIEKLRAAAAKAPPSPRSQATLWEAKAKVVGNLKETCFDPRAMGIVAIASLRGEIHQDPKQLADHLQAMLEQTKSLGLRNAIRLTLKEVYLEQGQVDQASRQVEMMIQENDQAVQAAPTRP